MKKYFYISAVLLIFLQSLSKAQDKQVLDKIIAIVGDEIVLWSDLQEQYQQYLAQGFEVYDNTKCLLLEDLLYQAMLVYQAKLDSVNVSEDQVNDELDRRIRFFVSQLGSEKQLEEYYKKTIKEIKDEFRELIRQQLLSQTMQAKITENIKISPFEVKQFYESLPKDSIPLINARVEVAHIVIYTPVSQEAKEYAIEKLKEIKSRVEKGEKFSTLALLYSQDPGSAKKGGELGWVNKADLVPEFAAATFKLKNPGDMSGIVETEFGYHLIQLIDKQGDKVNVRHILIKPVTDSKSSQLAKMKLDSIRNAILDTLSFEKAARLFSEDTKTKNNGGNLINPYTGTTWFDMDQLDPGVFFVIDKMKAGEISQPVPYKSPDGKEGYRIIYLKSRTEPHRANLQEDFEYLKELALNDKKNRKINQWLEEKIKETFVRIEPEWKSCNFTNPWVKNEN